MGGPPPDKKYLSEDWQMRLGEARPPIKSTSGKIGKWGLEARPPIKSTSPKRVIAYPNDAWEGPGINKQIWKRRTQAKNKTDLKRPMTNANIDSAEHGQYHWGTKYNWKEWRTNENLIRVNMGNIIELRNITGRNDEQRSPRWCESCQANVT